MCVRVGAVTCTRSRRTSGSASHTTPWSIAMSNTRASIAATESGLVAARRRHSERSGTAGGGKSDFRPGLAGNHRA